MKKIVAYAVFVFAVAFAVAVPARAVDQAILIIEKATTTTQPQAIIQSSQDLIQSFKVKGFEAEPVKAEVGQTFLVITFSLEVTEGEVEVSFTDITEGEIKVRSAELLWSHPQQKDTIRGCGKTILSGSNQWNVFYVGRTYKKGKHTFELLYIVPTDLVKGSSIKFLGKDYPVKGNSGR